MLLQLCEWIILVLATTYLGKEYPIIAFGVGLVLCVEFFKLGQAWRKYKHNVEVVESLERKYNRGNQSAEEIIDSVLKDVYGEKDG